MCDLKLHEHFASTSPDKLAVHDKVTGKSKLCKDYLWRSLCYFRDQDELSVTYRLDKKCGRMLARVARGAQLDHVANLHEKLAAQGHHD